MYRIFFSAALMIFLFPVNGNTQPTGWDFSLAIEIQENEGTNKSNYPISIELNTSSLVTAGNMQVDGSDIRFASDCQGDNPIDFWIEDDVNTDSTLIWIKLPFLSSNEKDTVFMFYGNSSATSASDFNATFPDQLIISTDTTLTMTDSIWKNDWVHIKSGVTVTLPDSHPGLAIHARKILIEGDIDGNGSGHLGGNSTQDGNGSGGGEGYGTTGAGGGYGGKGGKGDQGFGSRGSKYGSAITFNILKGSGGGGGQNHQVLPTSGGNGGGVISLSASIVDVSGNIYVNGDNGISNPQSSGGGGSGGGILLAGYDISLEGNCYAMGGIGDDASPINPGGGGGGGRIKIFYENRFTEMGTLDVSPGGAGSFIGTQGSIHKDPTYISGEPTYTFINTEGVCKSCAVEVTLSATETERCEDKTEMTRITATPSEGENYTYSWTPSGETTPFIDVAPATTTTFTVIVTDEDIEECNNEASIEIAVHPLPQVNLGNDTALCGSQTHTLDAGAGTGYIYEWQDASTNQTFFVEQPGIYSVTVTTLESCSETDEIEVVYDNVMPEIAIQANNTTVCPGETVNFSIVSQSFEGTAPIYQWKLNGADITGATSNTYSSTFSDGDVVTLQLTSSDPCAVPINVISNEINLTVANVTPSVSIVSDKTESCDGNMINFSISSIENEGANPTYQWKINGTDVPGETNATFDTSALTNSDEVSLTITSDHPCPDPASVSSNAIQVTILEVPEGGVLSSSLLNVCQKESVELTLSGNIGNIQLQDSSTGSMWMDISGGTSSPFTTAVLNENKWFRSISHSNCGSSISNIVEIQVSELPNAGDIGNNQTICDGEIVTLVSNNYNGTLQWEESNDGEDWLIVSEATSNTFTTPTLHADIWYRLKATTTGCEEDISNTVKITIEPLPTAGTIDGLSDVCFGQTASLELTGYSGNIQFQDSIDGESWENIPTAINNHFTSGMLSETTWFRVVVSTTNCGSELSNIFQANVIPLADVGNINGNQFVCEGQPANISTVDHNGDLQWQESMNQTDWSDISGENASSFTSASLTQEMWYRLIASVAGCNKDTSNIIHIDVDPSPEAGTLSGSSNICSGETVSFELVNSSGSLQFQDSTANGTWQDIPNALSQVYTTAALTEKTWFRVVIGNENCGSLLYSNEVEVNIKEMPDAGDIGSDQIICEGSTVSYTASSFTGDLQWQKNTDGINWENINTASNPTYTSNALHDNIWYRVVASVPGCGNDTSAVVQTLVEPYPYAGILSGDTTICSGKTTPLNLKDFVGNIQFKDSTDGSIWNAIPGAETPMYNTVSLGRTTWYRASVSTFCGTEISNLVEVKVNPLPEAGEINSLAPICQGSSATVSPNTFIGDLQWQESMDGWSWNDIPNETSDVLNTGSQNENIYYRLIATTSTCGKDSSHAQMLNVLQTPEAGKVQNDTTICINTQIQISATGVLGEFVWQVALDGTHFTNNIETINEPLFLYRSNSIGDVWYRVAAYNGACDTVFGNPVRITSIECPEPVSIPVSSHDTLCVNQSYTFTSTSLEADSIQWGFSGGTPSSANTTPIQVQYNAPGNYTVALEAYNFLSGFADTSRLKIHVKECPIPQAIIGFEDTTICQFSSIQFLSMSTDADSVKWWFEEGSPSEKVESNPLIMYDVQGTFDVTLIAYNEYGIDTLKKTDLITIQNCLPPPLADFDFVLDGLEVTFTNLSTNADQWNWDFGDGLGVSSDPNPVYTYASAGIYHVCLEAKNPGATDIICKDIDVVTDILEPLSKDEFLLYPIPASDYINIQFRKNNLAIEQIYLINILGEKIPVEFTKNTSGCYVNLSNMASGVYSLHTKINDKEYFLDRIVIQHK